MKYFMKVFYGTKEGTDKLCMTQTSRKHSVCCSYFVRHFYGAETV